MVDDRNVTFLISHQSIVDGFGELAASRVYVPLETFCGVCDVPIVLLPEDQKHLLEVRRIPVKMLRRGAARCVPCRQRRSRLDWLRQHDRWRSVPGGAEERDLLDSQESEARAKSKRRYELATWPYPRPENE